MRILITGVGGNLGHGLVDRLMHTDHELVLSDLVRPAWLDDEAYGEVAFRAIDVQIGVGLEAAAAGCDLVMHLPAWHGIHSRTRTEVDFWRLNVDGTFWMLQAARSAGVAKVVFLSSQSWHGHYDKYGFTKRIGEELLAYHHAQHGLAYVAVRPHDLTPWHGDWPQRYGTRLLYGGVDRDDVLDAVLGAADHLAGQPDAALVLDATRPNVYTADQLKGWDADPVGTLDRIFPGAADVVDRYRLVLDGPPRLVPQTGWTETGYSPTRHFGTFLQRITGMDPDEAWAVPHP